MAPGLLIAAILVAGLVPAQTLPEPYAWPLDLPRELTSSFGEFRPGRYHMGIDLHTGPIGKDVHAAADGYVARIRCSPYGYGKAVYLQLADGNSAVYAHLDDFAPALRGYVRRAQHAAEEYTVDLTPKPGEFPVKRGELIAKSGQTGIGVPHLHYELRDNSGVPINPRLLGVTWPDTNAPSIDSVMIVPLTPQSRVNGYFSARRVRIANAGRYGPQGPVNIEGPVGFALDVSDRGANKSRLGIRRVTVSCSDQEIFEVLNDLLSYEHTEDAAAAFRRGRYISLWRDPGNDSESYNVAPGDGAFVFTQPTGTVEMVVEDFAGNVAKAVVPITNGSGEPPPRNSMSSSGTPGHAFTGYALFTDVRYSRAARTWPELAIEGANMVRIPLQPYGDEHFGAAWLPDEPVADVNVYVDYSNWQSPKHRFVFIRRGAPAQQFDFGELRVHTQPDSPYGTLGFEVVEMNLGATGELIALGPGYQLRSESLSVDAPITISLPLPEGDPGTRAQFYRPGTDGWERVETTRADGRASATVKQLGNYQLFDDVTPPTLDLIRLEDNYPLDLPRISIRTGVGEYPTAAETLTVSSPRPAIRARVVDVGSGVESWRVTYDGRWLLTEYDPEQDLLRWEQDEDLPSGAGTLVVEVRDFAGNTSRRELGLVVP